MKKGLAYIHTCYICNKEVLGVHNKLPKGWFMPWDFVRSVCGGCRWKWQKRFNTLPIMWRDGNQENDRHRQNIESVRQEEEA